MIRTLRPSWRAAHVLNTFISSSRSFTMAKRKRSSAIAAEPMIPSPVVLPANIAEGTSEFVPPKTKRQPSKRRKLQEASPIVDTNPDVNQNIEDGQEALRASPDAEVKFEVKKATKEQRAKNVIHGATKSSPRNGASKVEDVDGAVAKSKNTSKSGHLPKKPSTKVEAAEEGQEEVEAATNPEAEGDEDANPAEMKEALSRPPPVNSSSLPLPWKGRLGYACLNTYLRSATPPVFSSRTCRIASILEHRHPLKDPTQPEHATKNRPDKSKPADVARGQAYVEALGLANARDIPKMLRWNEKYGIRFLRLSSEMFPFASHEVYGYKLAPFAAEALAEAGSVAAELGHRLTTHPGQFTQLGSPRPEVIAASIRDLEYHCELLDLLKLPPQANRDAVMILHMGGVFGDKAATLDRFRTNYAKLPQGVKNRLVLENDDVCYSVHDLLPICEELDIPFVLDYHHHNIIFDADQIREGTFDIMDLYPRIKATWDRKSITQKMHYSEPTPAAITGRQRRKHNPRVSTLPPCAPDMDLMIEAKDKEQAVFELMRTFKLPGFDKFNDIIPYTRSDENKAWKPPKKKAPKKSNKADADEDFEAEADPQPPPFIPDTEVAMGGSEGRVYWPPGMEEWLRPKKREVKPRDAEKVKSTAEKAAERRAERAAWQAAREASAEGDSINTGPASETGDLGAENLETVNSIKVKATGVKAKSASTLNAKTLTKMKKDVRNVPTPSTSDHESQLSEEEDTSSFSNPREIASNFSSGKTRRNIAGSQLHRRQSGRNAKSAVRSYAEDDDD